MRNASLRPSHVTRGLPLLFTTLLAMLFFVRGSLHPEMNYDVIPHVALAKQLHGAGGKARNDAIVFVTLIMLLNCLYDARARNLVLLLCAGAWSIYFLIQHVSGNFGYIAVVNFALIENGQHDVFPNPVPQPQGYALSYIHQILQTLGENPEFSKLSLALGLLARFLLFPRPWSRYTMGAYVLAGLLFARAIQPVALRSSSAASVT
jgi:hypothetical protein